MARSVHNKNNWDKVRDIRKSFSEESLNKYPYYAGFNQPWEILCKTIYSSEFSGSNQPIVVRDDDEKVAQTPLGAFLHYIDCGIYPPPELLIWLSDTFRHYYCGAGKLDLEEVFFGRVKPGVGNAASRATNESLYKKFSMAVSMEKGSAEYQGRKKLSQQAIAEQMFKQGGELIGVMEDTELEQYKQDFPDVESFLRSWRRWKNSDGKTD